MLLITKGTSSSYSIWSTMNKQLQGRGMAYININKRIRRLTKAGLLEETKIGESIHGRKDYKITMKGIEKLTPYILTHPEEVQNIIQYMDKFGQDKTAFGELLVFRIGFMLGVANVYLKSMGSPELTEIFSKKGAAQWGKLKESMNELSVLMKSVGPQQEDIDTVLTKYYDDLCHKLETKNIMSTLQDNGTKIRLSYIHPHKPKDIAKLTKLNIEKMKKTLPQTTGTMKYLEKIIKSIDEGRFKEAKTTEPTGEKIIYIET
jgi:hypothetical protein